MKVKYIFILLAALLASSATLHAQSDVAPNPLSNKQRSEAVKKITANYTNWGRCAIDGKVKAPGLPVNPSLKIFMQKENLILISLRAPFIGEVARIEASTDSLLLVNRMKKVYFLSNLADTDLFSDKNTAKQVIAQLQALLLARVIIVDKGELSTKNASFTTFYQAPDDGFIIVPDNKILPSWLSYGYLLYPDTKMQALEVNINSGAYNFSAQYSYNKNLRADIEVLLQYASHSYEATLLLDAPQYGANPFGRFSDFRGYRSVSLSEFLKSF